ncbi:hypothetical protein OO256_07435 [Pseudomonas sp. DCB_CB]|uniref:hypothetical protein n=1 Tax=Pseudomonas TaxID=286 RepID=UPI00224988A8|nr:MULTISPECIES: hypothetical protein [unclassified Pseudomonas]MCX2691081.1 hypothetical protein [Pseudomonas sp. DCB_BZ]MCX2855936.1 hypothetical protein [Pseudomonas sp. DCB_CB]
MSNFSDFQRDRQKKRMEIIDSVLEKATDCNMSFSKITYLARYVAGEISQQESAFFGALPDIKKRGKLLGQCRASGLLKSRLYRSQLENWFFSGKSSLDKAMLAKEASLQLDLAKLSIKYRQLEARYLDLQGEQNCLGNSEDGNEIVALRDGAAKVALALLKEFDDMWCVSDGVLRTNSGFVSRVIVPGDIFMGFLQECSDLGLSFDFAR